MKKKLTFHTKNFREKNQTQRYNCLSILPQVISPGKHRKRMLRAPKVLAQIGDPYNKNIHPCSIIYMK